MKFRVEIHRVVALVLAYQLLAAAPQCDRGTTYDIRMCWDKQDAAAAAEVASTYSAVLAAFHQRGLDTEPLAASQDAWTSARDKTCAFEYEQYLPGTIAPQLGAECDVRMTRARTQHLATVLKQKTRLPEDPVAPSDAVELNRIYRLYVVRLDKSQAASLAAAESAWTSYRDQWCAIEGGACSTSLAKERIAELEASWIGEPFWSLPNNESAAVRAENYEQHRN